MKLTKSQKELCKKIKKLHLKQKRLAEEIISLQVKCKHPTFVKKNDGNTGNYCSQDDHYWTDFYCSTCDARWYHDKQEYTPGIKEVPYGEKINYQMVPDEDLK